MGRKYSADSPAPDPTLPRCVQLLEAGRPGWPGWFLQPHPAPTRSGSPLAEGHFLPASPAGPCQAGPRRPSTAQGPGNQLRPPETGWAGPRGWERNQSTNKVPQDTQAPRRPSSPKGEPKVLRTPLPLSGHPCPMHPCAGGQGKAWVCPPQSPPPLRQGYRRALTAWRGGREPAWVHTLCPGSWFPGPQFSVYKIGSHQCRAQSGPWHVLTVYGTQTQHPFLPSKGRGQGCKGPGLGLPNRTPCPYRDSAHRPMQHPGCSKAQVREPQRWEQKSGWQGRTGARGSGLTTVGTGLFPGLVECSTELKLAVQVCECIENQQIYALKGACYGM